MRLLAQLSESNGTNSKPMLFYALITLSEHSHRLCSLLNYQSLLTQKKKNDNNNNYTKLRLKSQDINFCVCCVKTLVFMILFCFWEKNKNILLIHKRDTSQSSTSEKTKT